MTLYQLIEKANEYLSLAKKYKLTSEEKINGAYELAFLILEIAKSIQTEEEITTLRKRANLIKNEQSKFFITQLTDQFFRSNSSQRTAEQVKYLINSLGLPKAMPVIDILKLIGFKLFGKYMHSLFVPLTKKSIIKEMSNIILPKEKDLLERSLKKLKNKGINANISYLSEMVLGEKEAEQKTQEYIDIIHNHNVPCISVNPALLLSQLNLLDWENSVSLISERLKKIYRAAIKHPYITTDKKKTSKIIYLDIECYVSLYLTCEVFMNVLDDPLFHSFHAGIALQAYFPDSFKLQKQITDWAVERVKNGGAPIKIRLVKGAKLAFEKVNSSLNNWPLATYKTKKEVDANFKRMIIHGSLPQNAHAANIAIGTHNIFDIAFGLLERSEKNVEDFVSIEMIYEVTEPIRKALQILIGDLLIYCPTSYKNSLKYAIGYLLRRIDENTLPENFLTHSFNLRPGSHEWEKEAERFRESCDIVHSISEESFRIQNRLKDDFNLKKYPDFINDQITDWLIEDNRKWAKEIISELTNEKFNTIPLVIGSEKIKSIKNYSKGIDPSFPNKKFYNFELITEDLIDTLLINAKKAELAWQNKSIFERSEILLKTVEYLHNKRKALIGVMIADTGRILIEADQEMSRIIDYVSYNEKSFIKVVSDQWSMASLEPKGTVLIDTNLSEPAHIAGQITAALISGNVVILKPTLNSVLTFWQLANSFWQAGIPKNALQFIPCNDEKTYEKLIKDERLNAVYFNGNKESSENILKIRPDIDLTADIYSNNIMIVTALSDRKLAIKDIVESSFYYSGQHSSNAKLILCEEEVYQDKYFLEQLKDAVKSLSIGSAWDFNTKLGPLINAPSLSQKRALTELEETEAWLLKPVPDPDNPRIWSPGIKMGISLKSSFFSKPNPCPVIYLVKTNNLKHSLEIANKSIFGFTGSIHSLDMREQSEWKKQLKLGSYYLNRGLTGSRVNIQTQGGIKASRIGPYIKSGGKYAFLNFIKQKKKSIEEIYSGIDLTKNQEHILELSIKSYEYWQKILTSKKDHNQVLGQDNYNYYIPQEKVIFRIQEKDSALDQTRVLAAANICNSPIEISTPHKDLLHLKNPEIINNIIIEDDDNFILRLKTIQFINIRMLSKPAHNLINKAQNQNCFINWEPVSENGLMELTYYLKEIAISNNYHRYGYVGPKERKNK